MLCERFFASGDLDATFSYRIRFADKAHSERMDLSGTIRRIGETARAARIAFEALTIQKITLKDDSLNANDCRQNDSHDKIAHMSSTAENGIMSLLPQLRVYDKREHGNTLHATEIRTVTPGHLGL